ncbi:MAG: uroporphyrinogen-III synthase [Methylophilaceae bacterium]|nr:uroporphyrinogen-III synthase [Methylophilaceae bacterium]
MSAAPELALANIGVAITRPINQAKKLTQLIQNAGGNVIAFPLIEITALDDYSAFEQVIADINSYDWILFISSNAVENSLPRLIKQGIPKQLKFAAIGPTTAKSLQAFGIDEVLIPQDRFDSESLLSLQAMQNMQGEKVMIVRGIGGRDVLANTLSERGAQITFAECYQRVNPQTNCQVLEQAYNNGKLHAIVVTSSEAMRYLLAMAGESDWLKQITICVNHARVAEQPLKMGLKVKSVNASGDAAMLAILADV